MTNQAAKPTRAISTVILASLAFSVLTAFAPSGAESTNLLGKRLFVYEDPSAELTYEQILSKTDAFEKVEWWQRGKDTNDHAVNMVDDAMDNIKNYLKANGVELEKNNDE